MEEGIMNDKIPKVFISYSWSQADYILKIAERLMDNGVSVVIDKWDLHVGHSVTQFMEKCVADESIDKVLIFSDSKYAEKANNRTGGVGSETEIISQKVYESTQQEKFIPIVLEFDDNNKPCLPHYLSSRLYIDFTKDGAFEELLRNIYKCPLKRKPKLGSRPTWLDEPRENYASLKLMINNIEDARNARLQVNKSKDFLDAYVEEAKKFFVYNVQDSKETYDAFVNVKDLRDVYLDYVNMIYATDLNFSKIMISNFEVMYNAFMDESLKGNNGGCYDKDYQILKLHVWELFICVIAFLRYYEDYASINKLVKHTYFLKESCYETTLKAKSFCSFFEPCSIIDIDYKQKSEFKQYFTLIGKVLYESREKLPIFTSQALVESDLFLCQIFKHFNISGSRYWFPKSYVYVKRVLPEWQKLKSLEHCKDMMTLFGVDSLPELKKVFQECTLDQSFKYSGAWDYVPSILSAIKLDDIGTLN